MSLRRMTLKFRLAASLFSVFALVSVTSCGGSNYLTEMSNQSSDEALYAEALKLVDRKEYDEALVKLYQMSESGLGRDDVIQTEAGIYAGKCGLDFLSFVEGIGGSGGLFSLFMAGFEGAEVDVAHCQTAQDLIEEYFGATGAARISSLGAKVGGNVNLFMAVLGMTKIGAQLRATADIDGTGGLGDGSVDGGFNACQVGSITDANIVNVGTGFALLLDNITTIAAQLSDANETLLDGVETLCSDPALTTNPCTITSSTDPAWSTPATITLMRSLVRSQSIGIQSCAAGPGPLPYPFNCCP